MNKPYNKEGEYWTAADEILDEEFLLKVETSNDPYYKNLYDQINLVFGSKRRLVSVSYPRYEFETVIVKK